MKRFGWTYSKPLTLRVGVFWRCYHHGMSTEWIMLEKNPLLFISVLCLMKTHRSLCFCPKVSDAAWLFTFIMSPRAWRPTTQPFFLLVAAYVAKLFFFFFLKYQSILVRLLPTLISAQTDHQLQHLLQSFTSLQFNPLPVVGRAPASFRAQNKPPIKGETKTQPVLARASERSARL